MLSRYHFGSVDENDAADEDGEAEEAEAFHVSLDGPEVVFVHPEIAPSMKEVMMMKS